MLILYYAGFFWISKPPVTWYPMILREGSNHVKLVTQLQIDGQIFFRNQILDYIDYHMDGRILDYNMWRLYTVITHPKISQVSFPDKQRLNVIMFYLDLLKLKPTFFHRFSKGCKGSHSRKECKPGDWLESCWRLGGWYLAKCIPTEDDTYVAPIQLITQPMNLQVNGKSYPPVN